MTNNNEILIKNKERFCYSLEYIYLILKQVPNNKSYIQYSSIFTKVDSYFRTAIGITPDGPVLFSGSLSFKLQFILIIISITENNPITEKTNTLTKINGLALYNSGANPINLNAGNMAAVIATFSK